MGLATQPNPKTVKYLHILSKGGLNDTIFGL